MSECHTASSQVVRAGRRIFCTAAVAFLFALPALGRPMPAMHRDMMADMEHEHMMSAPAGSAASVAMVIYAANDPAPPTNFDIGTLTRKINTTSSKAQAMFNQGLRFFYAFNHRESYRAFKAALAADPGCVMCAWGIAMSLGVNINQLDEPEQDRVAALAILTKALSFPKAEPLELALVKALIPRYEAYSGDEETRQKQRNAKYADAMIALAAKVPNDSDIQTLYIDAVMNLQPWKYWNLDGSPHCEDHAAICGKIVPARDALEQGLARDPRHMGLVHWYIHLLEGSPRPDKVTPYADTLASLAPDAGHLQHMPSHIYYRVGDHLKSVAANRAAILKDEDYFKTVPLDHPEGDRYRWGYYRHNIHFMLASAMLTGRRDDIAWAADRMRNSENPDIRFRTDRYRGVYYQSLPSFMSADGIQALKAPPTGWLFATASWDYAQALAAVWTKHAANAHALLKKLDRDAAAFVRANPGDVNNGIVTHLMLLIAQARFDEMHGDAGQGVKLLEQAAHLRGGMDYDEPPFWMVPVQQTLAALLITLHHPDDAVRQLHASLGDLSPVDNAYTNYRGNGWAYYGLTLAYEEKGLSHLTVAERADYDAAKTRLTRYCSAGGCTFSPERM